MAKNTAKKTVVETVNPTVENQVVDNVVELVTAKTRGRKPGTKNKTIDFNPSSLIVEENIPVPTKTGRGRKSNIDKYPFANMMAGGSFSSSVNASTLDAIRARITNAAKAYAKANPDFDYTTRVVNDADGNPILFRLWRTAKA